MPRVPRSTPSFATPATDRPDLFWLVADELRADALGCLSADPRAAGSFSRHTPHLDRLAASGAVFSRAYCQAPVCVASRASFLSGRYPQATGNAWFDDTPPGLPMAPERLRDAGYLTVNFGKEHHHRPASPFAVSRLRGAGDDPAYLREGDPRSLGPDFAGREAELGVIRLRATNDLIVAGTNPLPPAEAETGYLVRRAIEWLDAHRALSRRRPLLFRLSCLYRAHARAAAEAVRRPVRPRRHGLRPRRRPPRTRRPRPPACRRSSATSSSDATTRRR